MPSKSSVRCAGDALLLFDQSNVTSPQAAAAAVSYPVGAASDAICVDMFSAQLGSLRGRADIASV